MVESLPAIAKELTLRRTLDTEEMIDSAEFAALLGVRRQSIYQMRHKGHLPPATRLGRSVKWRRSVVLRWLDENTETS